MNLDGESIKRLEDWIEKGLKIGLKKQISNNPQDLKVVFARNKCLYV